ncbi:MAG: TetR/AcrR family transcriptional regulator [Candidatus Xenobiia bacterium LiM19]
MKSINDTKQKLIDTTRQIIDAGGIHSVSMREIGSKVQLSRSAAYRHFKSKEDLLAAIVLENFKTLKNSICDLINGVDDPLTVLEAVLRYYYDFGVRNREHYRLMFGNQFNKEQYPDIHYTAFEIFEIVSNSIEKAQRQKHVTGKPSKIPAAVAYAFIHGLVELNLAGHYEPEKGLDTPYDLIHSFLDMLQV